MGRVCGVWVMVRSWWWERGSWWVGGRGMVFGGGGADMATPRWSWGVMREMVYLVFQMAHLDGISDSICTTVCDIRSQNC